MLRAFSVTYLGTVIATSLTACAPSAATDGAIRTVRIYDLIRALPRATLQVHKAEYVAPGWYTVNDEARHGILIQSSGTVIFPPVRVSPASVLTFKIGVADDAWDKSGDGVTFEVFVRKTNDASTEIFSQYIDPKHDVHERRWIEERLALRQFGNQEIRIMFVTDPGPANDYNFDWGVFADPEITLSSER